MTIITTEVIGINKPKNCTGPIIRRYRETAGLSRTALARALRKQSFIITPHRIKRIEEQTSCVFVNDLVAFAHFFKIKVADLFDDKNIKYEFNFSPLGGGKLNSHL